MATTINGYKIITDDININVGKDGVSNYSTKNYYVALAKYPDFDELAPDGSLSDLSINLRGPITLSLGAVSNHMRKLNNMTITQNTTYYQRDAYVNIKDLTTLVTSSGRLHFKQAATTLPDPVWSDLSIGSFTYDTLTIGSSGGNTGMAKIIWSLKRTDTNYDGTTSVITESLNDLGTGGAPTISYTFNNTADAAKASLNATNGTVTFAANANDGGTRSVEIKCTVTRKGLTISRLLTVTLSATGVTKVIESLDVSYFYYPTVEYNNTNYQSPIVEIWYTYHNVYDNGTTSSSIHERTTAYTAVYTPNGINSYATYNTDFSSSGKVKFTNSNTLTSEKSINITGTFASTEDATKSCSKNVSFILNGVSEVDHYILKNFDISTFSYPNTNIAASGTSGVMPIYEYSYDIVGVYPGGTEGSATHYTGSESNHSNIDIVQFSYNNYLSDSAWSWLNPNTGMLDINPQADDTNDRTLNIIITLSKSSGVYKQYNVSTNCILTQAGDTSTATYTSISIYQLKYNGLAHPNITVPYNNASYNPSIIINENKHITHTNGNTYDVTVNVTDDCSIYFTIFGITGATVQGMGDTSPGRITLPENNSTTSSRDATLKCEVLSHHNNTLSDVSTIKVTQQKRGLSVTSLDISSFSYGYLDNYKGATCNPNIIYKINYNDGHSEEFTNTTSNSTVTISYNLGANTYGSVDANTGIYTVNSRNPYGTNRNVDEVEIHIELIADTDINDKKIYQITLAGYTAVYTYTLDSLSASPNPVSAAGQTITLSPYGSYGLRQEWNDNTSNYVMLGSAPPTTVSYRIISGSEYIGAKKTSAPDNEYPILTQPDDGAQRSIVFEAYNPTYTGYTASGSVRVTVTLNADTSYYTYGTVSISNFSYPTAAAATINSQATPTTPTISLTVTNTHTNGHTYSRSVTSFTKTFEVPENNYASVDTNGVVIFAANAGSQREINVTFTCEGEGNKSNSAIATASQLGNTVTNITINRFTYSLAEPTADATSTPTSTYTAIYSNGLQLSLDSDLVTKSYSAGTTIGKVNSTTGIYTFTNANTSTTTQVSGDTVTLTATYGGKTATKDATPKQAVDAVTGTTWDNPVISTFSYDTNATAAGSTISPTVYISQNGTENHKNGINKSVTNITFTKSFEKSGTNLSAATLDDNNGDVTFTYNPNTTTRYQIVKLTVTGSGSKTASKIANNVLNKAATLNADVITPSVTSITVTLSYPNSTVAYDSTTAQSPTYTITENITNTHSNGTSSTSSTKDVKDSATKTWSVNQTSYSEVPSGTFKFTSSNTGTAARSSTVTLSATSSGKTGSATYTITQQGKPAPTYRPVFLKEVGTTPNPTSDIVPSFLILE